MDAFAISKPDKAGRAELSGALTIASLPEAEPALQRLRKGKVQALDIGKLEVLDTAGALILCDIAKEIPIAGASEAHRALLELVARLHVKTIPPEKKLPPFEQGVTTIGKNTVELKQEAYRLLVFIGQSAIALAEAVRQPKHLRFSSIAHHIQAIGIMALPIIGLMAFFISVVLAYQGVAQLRPYGGEQFTVDLVALSILREMGVLLTAIMVAGRSGSAFTAEIGVMKAREEVDALEVIGVNPFEILVVPRLVAIVIALPLLTFYADMMGLIGGFFITHELIGIGLGEYLQRVHLRVGEADFFVGIFKAPVFAFFIGVIGCMHGLRVTGSAESIGRETTRSVVKSIFVVLVLDALFSILFEKLGI
jgi:phospholipid/cholesterol/gamma-HCH transport system permease protein